MSSPVKLPAKISAAARLVGSASSQKKLSGLNDILKVLAKELGACGCVLWEATPGSDLLTNPPRGGLFAVGAWFEKQPDEVTYHLDADSKTRKAIITGEFVDIPDTHVMPGFRGPTQVRAFSSVGVRLPQDPPAAINVYRDVVGPITPHQQSLSMELAGLIGPAYAALVNRVGFNLVSAVRTVLRDAEQKLTGPSTPPSETLVTNTLDAVVKVVQETFDCVEVGVLLEDRVNAPGEFVLKSTKGTWPPNLHRSWYRSGQGRTGWAIEKRKSVRILDLTQTDEDRATIQAAYPGIDLSFPSIEDLKQQLRLPGTSEEDPVRPVGFMCSPIVSRNRVLGAIRCVAIRHTPSYFDHRQVEVLELVASFLGDWWDNWLSRVEAGAELKAWNLVKEIVSGLGKLPAHTSSSIRHIYEVVLPNVARIIPNLDTLDVCLVTPDREDLRFEAFYAVGAKPANARTIQQRTFSLRGDPRSAEAVAVREKRTYTVRDVYSDPNYVPVFPQTRRMLCVPIRSGDVIVGVLDLRRAIDVDFTDTETKIAELLGQQLGLYHNLSQSFQRLQMETTQRMNIERSHAEIYRNLQHEIRSPIVTAHRIATLMDDSVPRQGTGPISLASIRSLTRRADRVAHSMTLFAALTQDKPVSLGDRVTLTRSGLVNRLNQAGRDHEITIPPQRKIRFSVDDASFEVLTGIIVQVDLKLLDQMIDNLLDNAAKYSYPRTRVRISGGTQRSGEYFYISVQSQGLRINPNEAKKVLEKEYRGDEARQTTGEGFGLGLWIANMIMKAHGGEVVVIPTTSQGVTDVRLAFPRLAKSDGDL